MLIKYKLLKSGNVKVDVLVGLTMKHYTMIGYTREEAKIYWEGETV